MPNNGVQGHYFLWFLGSYGTSGDVQSAREFRKLCCMSPATLARCLAYSPEPAQDSTRALQDIASTLKSRESSRSGENTARALQDISRTLNSIDSTLKKRDR